MTYSPVKLLTENRKTHRSIDLPIKGHCVPTKTCSSTCYARRGNQAFPNPKRKQKYLSRYLKGKDISRLIEEVSKQKAVRLNGSGDLLPSHIENVIRLAEACPDTYLWGMTRKPVIAREINGAGLHNLNILLTVDISSKKSLWKYPGRMCFGPRLVGHEVPDDDRIITVFPYHSAGRIIGNIPEHPKDCPAVRKTKKGCMACRKCWEWN